MGMGPLPAGTSREENCDRGKNPENEIGDCMTDNVYSLIKVTWSAWGHTSGRVDPRLLLGLMLNSAACHGYLDRKKGLRTRIVMNSPGRLLLSVETSDCREGLATRKTMFLMEKAQQSCPFSHSGTNGQNLKKIISLLQNYQEKGFCFPD